MPQLSTRLLTEQNECSLCWITKEGTPAGTVISFVFYENYIWFTALASSHRVKAIQRNPNVVVVISGKGSPGGHSRCLSLRGHCEVTHDPQDRDRFFPAFASAVLANSRKGAALMADSMHSPENLVLRFKAKKEIPYDSQAMFDAADRM